jgi:acetyl/propionyl-CoA carboxylase alpha subunit/acetyl-CoA carboxylase carboxyltransferase component
MRMEEGSDLWAIALYTDPDRLSPFVREADEALNLGAAFQESAAGEMKSVYLDYDKLVAALRTVRADAVWPGWGFVAEHPAFADRLAAEGITFLGPTGDTMRRLGDKIMSKRIAEAAGVPVSAWSKGPVERDEVAGWATKIGYPLVLKATAGGGGRGIRMVDSQEELLTAYDSATSEARNAFGDGTLFAEACIANARHVEVQMAADQHGGVLALGLRDCSVQRKHQKVLEEGPPPGLSEALMQRMRDASVALLRDVGYRGVATCEYLVVGEDFYFLEVNPRLQVEHGVTELLTGFDLVKTQVRIARGERLPESAPESRGFALEARLCAEDPASGFAPSPGFIALLDLPAGPGIRVDSGIAAGMSIPSEFDSMIAKVIAHGATREEARARLSRAVLDTRVVIEGGQTNKGFLLDVLDHPDFRAGGVTTGWLDGAALARPTRPMVEALLVAVIHQYQKGRASTRANFFAEASRGRPITIPGSTGDEIDLVYNGRSYRFHVFALGSWAYRIHHEQRAMQVTLLEQGPFARLLITQKRRAAVLVSASDVEIRVDIDGRQHRVACDIGGRVRAPAPCLLIDVVVKAGDRVATGDRLGLFEAMKCETAFHAPLGGVVREVCARPGERLNGGDVIVVIEPSETADEPRSQKGLDLDDEPHPLDRFLDVKQRASLAAADALPASERSEAALALRSQVQRILLGYDVSPARAAHLVQALSSSVATVGVEFRNELGALVQYCLELYADLEILFSRAPTTVGTDELGPSNDARMAMYLRRIVAKGAGIDPGFLALLRRALEHYRIRSLEPTNTLERAVLRLYSTRATSDVRSRLATALLHLAMHLAEAGDHLKATTQLRDALDRIWMLRGTVKPTVSDLAAQVRFLIYDRKAREKEISPSIDVDLTVVPPPEGTDLAPFAEPLGLSIEQARRLELWRLMHFELERIEVPGFDGIVALFGKSREGRGDERLFVFAELTSLGTSTPEHPDIAPFEQQFHAAVEAMRSIQSQREDAQRLHWNRLYLLVRPPVVLSERLVATAMRRLAPETGHLGLERVIVRIARLDPAAKENKARKIELLAGNPTGGRVEWSVREPHNRPLEAARSYERRVALARARGLTYPYEIIRLFTAAADPTVQSIGQPAGRGTFTEYDLEGGRAVPIRRDPGKSTCALVMGVISTPTRKHPEGMRRVLVLSDPTLDMGALSAAECDRIVAAIDLAEREQIPVEWVAVSAGARIAMDSGTENLDATARVVRRLVTFTDRGGEVNLLLPGVNVGAQSYFDALATMGLGTRGILVMLPAASMVLTGRAALQFAGGVAAEDEVGIGGYERIMGPNGEAHYRARDLSDAYAILLEHYAVSYRAPGEAGPRRFDTRDPADRDFTLSPYEGPEGFKNVSDVFSPEENPGRKRPFAMRSVMRAVIDVDGGYLERWRDWADAQTAIVWDCHIGGAPATLIGVESHQLPRIGYTPNDGPNAWTAATLFPPSSKKVARALNAASNNRPAVILANLSGFDGSPESMRRGVLEMGAEIARAVVRFRGKIAFVVVTRYHGGAYVVFSHELNDGMKVAALAGSYASVIGGAAAAAVVFGRDVRKRALADARVHAARAELEASRDAASRAAARTHLSRVIEEVTLEKQADVAAEFDAVHTVERAQKVGSLHTIIDPKELRQMLASWLSE